MRVEELRIGNWVYYVNEYAKFEELRVSSLHSDNTLRLKKDGESIGCFRAKSLIIKPIPLSDEWFDKFGFEEIAPSQWRLNKILIIELFDEDLPAVKYVVGVQDQSNERMMILPTDNFKYVHQLQNIHFALTGKELINE